MNHLTLAGKIYPNPAKDQLQFTFFKQMVEPLTCAIYNSSNKRMLQKKLDSNDLNQVLDISNLPSGMYFLQVTSEKKQVSKKFIKIIESLFQFI